MEFLIRLYILIITLVITNAAAPTVIFQGKKGDATTPTGTESTLCANIKTKFDAYPGGSGYPTSSSDPNFPCTSKYLTGSGANWLTSVPNVCSKITITFTEIVSSSWVFG